MKTTYRILTLGGFNYLQFKSTYKPWFRKERECWRFVLDRGYGIVNEWNCPRGDDPKYIGISQMMYTLKGSIEDFEQFIETYPNIGVYFENVCSEYFDSQEIKIKNYEN